MNLAMDIWPLKAFARGREAAGVSVTKRLHAWWEGYDLPDSDDAAETSPVDEPLEEISIDGDETPENRIMWSEERRKLVQILWGQGFTYPGGVDYACELVSGFSLNPAVSMVEVGAGWLMPQDAFAPETLAARLTALFELPATLEKTAASARAAGRADAAARLADVVVELVPNGETEGRRRAA